MGGPKRQVEVIDLATSKQRVVLRKHADWITQLAFSRMESFLPAVIASAASISGIYTRALISIRRKIMQAP